MMTSYKLCNDAMLQKMHSRHIMRTENGHHTTFSASVLEWEKFNGASFVGVQITITQLCKCKHECKWLESKDQAMSRLFLTLAQARFLNWALKCKFILTVEIYRLLI